MSRNAIALIALTVAFGALTTIALVDVGPWGIFEPHFKSWGAAQVFWDLVIIAVLAVVWMVRDGRARGLNPWPFVFLTVVAGSFGPLLYLIVREVRGSAKHPAETSSRLATH